MTLNTVRELIEFLQTLDPNLSILKSDMQGAGYNPITMIEPVVYGVKINPDPKHDCLYIDCPKGDNGFPALVL
jgi:hypothetical protein